MRIDEPAEEVYRHETLVHHDHQRERKLKVWVVCNNTNRAIMTGGAAMASPSLRPLRLPPTGLHLQTKVTRRQPYRPFNNLLCDSHHFGPVNNKASKLISREAAQSCWQAVTCAGYLKMRPFDRIESSETIGNTV
jgi:hypothetical protein